MVLFEFDESLFKVAFYLFIVTLFNKVFCLFNCQRPIVEFSLENKKALEAKEKRLEKSKVSPSMPLEAVEKLQDQFIKCLWSLPLKT